jgi:hypothetical protein
MKSFYQKNGALLSALAFVTIMLQFILPGCSKLDSLSREEAIVTPPIVSVGSSFSNVSTQIIYAGQTINAGMITYDDVDTNGDQQDDALQVTFQASNG